MVMTFSLGTQASWLPAATMIHWSVMATRLPETLTGLAVAMGQETTWIFTNLPTGGVPGEEVPEFWAAADMPEMEKRQKNLDMLIIFVNSRSASGNRCGDTTRIVPKASQKRKMKKPVPHQSRGRHVRFPGASLAAGELGVTRGHLYRVLTGERKSPPLVERWKEWLRRNPQFSNLPPHHP